MKVKDLIKKLKEMPKEAPVCFIEEYESTLNQDISYIYEYGEIEVCYAEEDKEYIDEYGNVKKGIVVAIG